MFTVYVYILADQINVLGRFTTLAEALDCYDENTRAGYLCEVEGADGTVLPIEATPPSYTGIPTPPSIPFVE